MISVRRAAFPCGAYTLLVLAAALYSLPAACGLVQVDRAIAVPALQHSQINSGVVPRLTKALAKVSEENALRLKGGQHSDWVNNIPGPVKFIFAVGGIFLSFSYFALLQEDLFKKKYAGQKFKSTFFMMVVERGINALVAFIFVQIFGGNGGKIPVGAISLSGATQMLAMAASNEALRYVSYPTQVLGKSCKIVPVMLFGILIGGKFSEYGLADYLQVLTVTAGVVMFNLNAPAKPGKGGQSDSAYGLGLIAGSLALDGCTGGLQDRVKNTVKKINYDPNDPKGSAQKQKLSAFESMLFTNLAGAVVALLFALVTGHAREGLAFCGQSKDFVRALAAFALCSALGQCFIYYTIAEFSPLVLATVTTTRKIFSTLVSVFRDPNNHLNQKQWLGCGLVFAGIIGEQLVNLAGGGKHGRKH